MTPPAASKRSPIPIDVNAAALRSAYLAEGQLDHRGHETARCSSTNTTKNSAAA